MSKCVLLVGSVLLLSFNLECKEPILGANSPLPSFKMGSVQSDSTAIASKVKAEAKILMPLVEGLVVGILRFNRGVVIDQIHDGKGAFIDYKAEKTKKEIIADINNDDGLLYPIIWDTDRLAKLYPSTDIKSFKDYFASAEEITFTFFFYSTTECEVQLLFEDRPAVGVMGNPIYHKIDGKWYLRRIF